MILVKRLWFRKILNQWDLFLIILNKDNTATASLDSTLLTIDKRPWDRILRIKASLAISSHILIRTLS